ncbi:MAG: dihydrofolate reductase [Prevotella sp.]|nr:dihydrofolate reductase [Prevotella sp.]
MTINIIAAVAKNRAIGKDNKLIYWLPNDMKRFKSLTTGHTIVMGRKTFDSLPKGALPNRRNIVLSRSSKQLPGCDCYASLEDALSHCQPDEDIFIIGGESVYRQALPCADRLYMTEVDDTPSDADAFFPPYDDWKKVSEERHTIDEKHRFAYSFVDYIKNEDCLKQDNKPET